MAVAKQGRGALAKVDPVWSRMRDEAREIVDKEPLLGSLVHAVVLHHDTLENALSYRVAQKLSSPDMPGLILRDMCNEVLAADAELRQAARADIVAVHDRDPACHRYVQPLLFFKGFLAIQSYRIGHHLWMNGQTDMAYYIQKRLGWTFIPARVWAKAS